MNNHWETNYRAYQEGIITFRYALRPHGAFHSAKATRFATGLTQPLIVAKALDQEHSNPKLTLSSGDVIVQVLKPRDDGKAWMVTLYNASAEKVSTMLQWSGSTGGMHYSNTTEIPITPAMGAIEIAALDVVTVRVEK